jgi:uncharacterized protein YbbC (DUF1343 family)
VGAPWLDTPQLMRRLARYSFPGVALDTARFVPQGEGWVPFRGEAVRALRIRVTERDAFSPVWLTLVLLTEIRAQHLREFRVTNEGMTQMLGSRWAREAIDRGEAPQVIWDRWNDELQRWKPVRERYALYAPGRG